MDECSCYGFHSIWFLFHMQLIYACLYGGRRPLSAWPLNYPCLSELSVSVWRHGWVWRSPARSAAGYRTTLERAAAAERGGSF